LEHELEHRLNKSLISESDTVLVAVSGGRDSVALAHLLVKAEVRIALAHVNYGLRGSNSEKDAAFVQALGLVWDVPVYMHNEIGKDWGSVNIQIHARNIRYAFFEQLCSDHGFTKIATAHHAEDNIETLFLNLLRGTGIDGIKGIPEQRGKIIRPILSAHRDEVDRYIARHKLQYRDDKSNAETKYKRNKIRHDLISLLKEIDSDALAKLDASMRFLNADAVAIAERASNQLKVIPEKRFALNLADLPLNSRATWLYHALKPFGFNRTQCADLVESKSGGRIETEQHIAAKKGSEIFVSLAPIPIEPMSISGLGVYETPNFKLEFTEMKYEANRLPKVANQIWMDATTVQFPLMLRRWQEGEKFRPIGSEYDVFIGKYLKDFGLNHVAKKEQLVLATIDNEVLYIVGVRLSDKVKCSEATKKVISIKMY
jgi:tRNA(Ile)-lysidine synthase